jgi:hypothetical protein
MIKKVYARIRQLLDQKEKLFLLEFNSYCDKQVSSIEQNLKECKALSDGLSGLTEELEQLKAELGKWNQNF